MTETDFLSGGLADPVLAGQSAFRAIMQAMAEPGTVHAVADCPTPPSGLSRTMAAIATTLCDADTPIWLDAALATFDEIYSNPRPGFLEGYTKLKEGIKPWGA